MEQPAHSPTRSAFLFWLTAAMAAALVIGFSRSFFLAPVLHVKPLNAALVAHGMCGTAWFVMLCRQSWLAARGRMAEHMRAGRMGIPLAIAAVASALWVVAESIGDGKATGSGLSDAEGLLIQSSTIAWFTILASFGFANRRRPELHKRLMILATIAMMAPAFSRIKRLMPDGGPTGVDSAWLASVFIGALALYDWRKTGRVHGVTWGVGIAYLAWVSVRLPIAKSQWWADFAATFLT